MARPRQRCASQGRRRHLIKSLTIALAIELPVRAVHYESSSRYPPPAPNPLARTKLDILAAFHRDGEGWGVRCRRR